MKIKHLTILTLVFVMMVALVGVVAAHDGGMQGNRGGRGAFGDSTIVTDATGLTIEELRDAIRNGSTIAELIEANGGNVDTVIANLVAEATNDINSKLDSGDITQERADMMLENIEERITDRVNNTQQRPEFGQRDGRRGHGGRDKFDSRGDTTPDNDDTTVEPSESA